MWPEHALVGVGGYLEVARERNFIVPVDRVHNAIVYSNALIHMVVEPHLVEVGHTQQLTFRLTGVYDGAEQVEHGGKLQRLADRPHKLHGFGKELGMQIHNATLVERTVQFVEVVGKHHPVVGNHVRCSAGACGCIVAVFGHLIARARYHKAGSGGDVERVFAVASRAHHVYVAVAVEQGGHTGLQNTVAKTEQFFNGHAPHLQGSEQSRYLFVGELTLGNSQQNVASLFAREVLVVEHSVQDVFHCCHFCVCLVGCCYLFVLSAPQYKEKGLS